jgi:mono/diheme cytochrome c family protein
MAMHRRAPFLPLVFIGALATASLATAVTAEPIDYKLPKETAAFKPGPNLDVVQNNCTACHSADYVSIQPRGPKFKKDFWQAEVTKMIKVYGAPIDDADVPKIVEYLTATY